MTSYDSLQDLIDLEQITNVFYGISQILELDVSTTLELMKDTSLEALDSSIVFYGKDFKIDKIEDSYECYFEMTKLSKPKATEKVTPTTLKSREMRYSEEYSMKVPMITQSTIEKESKRAREIKRAHHSRMTELNKMVSQTADYPTTEDIEDFTIFESNGSQNAAYIVLPEFPAHKGSFTITDDHFVEWKDRILFDFIGYAGFKHDGILQTRFYASYEALNPTAEEEEYALAREKAFTKLLADKKLVKVIGISATMLDYEESPKEFLERNLYKIKKYYQSR